MSFLVRIVDYTLLLNLLAPFEMPSSGVRHERRKNDDAERRDGDPGARDDVNMMLIALNWRREPYLKGKWRASTLFHRPLCR